MRNQEKKFGTDEQLVELIDRLFVDANYVDCHVLLCKHRERLLASSPDCEGWFFLRYGQVLLELDRPEESKKALVNAFSDGGFDLFSNGNEKYLSHIQFFVDGRVKAYERVTQVLLLSFIGFISALFVSECLGIGQGTLSSWWVFTGFFVFFLTVMVVAGFLSPYNRSGTSASSGETGEFGPVD